MSKKRRIVLVVAALAVLPVVGYLSTWAVRGLYNHYVYRQRLRDTATGVRGITYYVSASGDDSHAGTSPQSAWRTISKVNHVDFAPGDSILFEGGHQFDGELRFDDRDAGTPARPIIVGSYGTGRATIVAGKGEGVSVYNTMGFHVQDLNVVGSGYETNNGSGISFTNDLAGNVKLDHVRIERVEVSGFGRWGILIDGNNMRSGFRDVRITYVDAHDNGLAGLYIFGDFSRFSPSYAHEDVYIANVRAFNNPGRPGPNRKHSGSGIVISDVDRGVIERSVAYNNGWLCDSSKGGPVGIWAWDSNAITIQHNESHHNRTGGRLDGGGFDLDGGMTNSVMQYNYSHDNEGAGFLVMQYTFARSHHDNVVRYNISHDDGRKNSYAGLQLWGDVRGTDFYNNTVFVSGATGGRPGAVYVNQNPDALFFENHSPTDVRFRNNIFYALGEAQVLNIADVNARLRFEGNDYFAAGTFEILWADRSFKSLADWRAAVGQERAENRDTGTSIDPKLRDASAAKTIGDPLLLEQLDAYRLADDSPLIGAGLDLAKLYGISVGGRDFYGNSIPQGGAFDVGANEVGVGARGSIVKTTVKTAAKTYDINR